MSRGEVVALTNFQSTLLLDLGNGKAEDLYAVMVSSYSGSISNSIWVSASLDKQTTDST